MSCQHQALARILKSLASASAVVPAMQRRPNTAQSRRRERNKKHKTKNQIPRAHKSKSSASTHHTNHTTPPSFTIHKKPNGSVRLVYKNTNGLTPWNPNNDQISLTKTFLKNISADAYISTETRAQWDMLHPTQQLKLIFQSDKPVKTITSFNKGEAITRSQEGGTSMIMFDRMATLAVSPYSDPLGRWC